MSYYNKLYSIFIYYSYLYVYYINCNFLFFLLYLFFAKLYIFSGDIYHGISSYLLILHSSLAITSNIFYYLLVLFFFFYSFYKKCIKNYLRSIYNVIYLLSLYIINHILLFIFTGVIWSEYSWGFFISIEYRIIKLLFLLVLYSSYCIFYKLVKNKFIYINILFFIFIFFFFIFDFFIFSSISNTFEIHQNDNSLHLFLISISGSYMFTITLLIFYLFFLVLNIIIVNLYSNQILYMKYKSIFYKQSIT